MVRLVGSYFRANSLPVVGRETPDIFEGGAAFSPSYPHHLKEANMALDDLDSLSYASRKHDRDFIDDLNARAIVDVAHHGLPPRARRHHVVSSSSSSSGAPAMSHVSRRVVVGGGGGEVPYYAGHYRGYSLPPASSGYTRIGINLGGGGYSESYQPSRDYRRHSVADTAVRHAHREVDRVQRELANQEDPYFAALKRTPIPVAKYRSMYVPRSSSVAVAGLRSTSPVGMAAAGDRPSYYHYYYHKEQPVSDHDDDYYHYRRRPLYSPVSLVRCLTATPVAHVRSHSPVGSRMESYIRPALQTAMTSQPAALTKVHRSSSYHGPRFYRSSSAYTLPESVGHWYHKTPHHVPLESNFRYGGVPYSVPHVSSSYVKYSSPPPSYDFSTGPQPPYHSMVYSGPSAGAGGTSSSYSYSYNTSGMSPSLSHASHGHQHYRAPAVTHSYVTHHQPPKVTKTVYTTSSSSSAGHAPTSGVSHVQVSNTRKKVRDVLCKVKKDPTYFDD